MLDASVMASSLIRLGPFFATSRPTILLDRLTPSKMVSMLRFRTFRALLLLAPLAAGCGDNNSTNTPTGPGPVQVSQTFTSEDDPSTAVPPVTGPLNPNGGRTHAFTVQQAGTVTATLTALGPDDTVIVGLSLGTWNGQVCQVI